MNQSISWSAFSVGLTTFVGISGEMVTEHTKWVDFLTPYGFIHLIILGAAFVLMIGGALGIQLPRSSAIHGDRKDDVLIEAGKIDPARFVDTQAKKEDEK